MAFKDYDEYLKKYRYWENEEEGVFSPQVRALSRVGKFFDTLGH